MSCKKCGGFLVRQYDVFLGVSEELCLNCGNRPMWPRKRIDGQADGAPLLCRKCKERPRMTTRMGQGAMEIEIEICSVCRVEEIMYRRRIDGKRRKTLGNVKAFSGAHLRI